MKSIETTLYSLSPFRTVVTSMKETKDIHESVAGHDLAEEGPFKHG